MTFEPIWATYQEGKRLRVEQKERERLAQEREAMERAIFGGKLSEWLMDKGTPQGPELGREIRKAREILSETDGLPPDVLPLPPA